MPAKDYVHSPVVAGLAGYNEYLSNQDKKLLERIRVPNPQKIYFHISRSDKIKHLAPRVPDNKYTHAGIENGTIARACVSYCIERCLIAVGASAEINVDKAIENLKKDGADPSTCVFFDNPSENKPFTEQDAFWVYTVEPHIPVYRPTPDVVVDAAVTGEHWLLSRIKATLVGQIRVTGIVPNKLDPREQYTIRCRKKGYEYLSGVHQVFLPKFKWVKKFAV